MVYHYNPSYSVSRAGRGAKGTRLSPHRADEFTGQSGHWRVHYRSVVVTCSHTEVGDQWHRGIGIGSVY